MNNKESHIERETYVAGKRFERYLKLSPEQKRGGLLGEKSMKPELREPEITLGEREALMEVRKQLVGLSKNPAELRKWFQNFNRALTMITEYPEIQVEKSKPALSLPPEVESLVNYSIKLIRKRLQNQKK